MSDDKQDIADLIRAYGNAMFDCGQWDEEDDEGYAVVHKRAKDAEAALIAALPSSLNALRGLHKAVAQLSEHFDKPITDDNVTLWLALNSAQTHAAKVIDAANGVLK